MGIAELRTPLRFAGEVRALVREERGLALTNRSAYVRVCADELPSPLPEKVGYLLRRDARDAPSIDCGQGCWEVACAYDLETLEPVLPVNYGSDAYVDLADRSAFELMLSRVVEAKDLGDAALGRAWRQARERLEKAGDKTLAGMLGKQGVPRETSRQEIERRYLKSGTTSYSRDKRILRDATHTERLLAIYAPETLEKALSDEDKRGIAHDILSERSWQRAEAAYADDIRASFGRLRQLAAALEAIDAKTVRVVFSEEDPKGLSIEKEGLRRSVAHRCEVPRDGWDFTPPLCHDARGEILAVRYRGKDIWVA